MLVRAAVMKYEYIKPVIDGIPSFYFLCSLQRWILPFDKRIIHLFFGSKACLVPGYEKATNISINLLLGAVAVDYDIQWGIDIFGVAYTLLLLSAKSRFWSKFGIKSVYFIQYFFYEVLKSGWYILIILLILVITYLVRNLCFYVKYDVSEKPSFSISWCLFNVA